MKSIFFGLVLVVFDFIFTAGSFRIGLVPDFVGYILILKGAREFSERYPEFEGLKKLLSPIIFVSLALYIVEFFGVLANLPVISNSFHIILEIIAEYFILQAFVAVQKDTGFDLCTKKLFVYFVFLGIMKVMSAFSSVIAIFGPISFVGTYLAIALFMSKMYDAIKNYEEKVMLE